MRISERLAVKREFSEDNSSHSVVTLKANPETPELLEIYREKNGLLEKCPNCGQGKDFIELERYLVQYSIYGDSRTISRSAPISERQKELERFKNMISKIKRRGPLKIRETLYFKPIHDPTCNANIPDDDIDYLTSSEDIFKSEYIKIRLEGNMMRAYLKLDPLTVSKFPYMDQICRRKLSQKMLESYFKHGTVAEAEDLRKYENMFGDTSEFPEYEVPPGFALTLRDYQKRNLSWMCAIEDPIESDANTIYHTSYKNYVVQQNPIVALMCPKSPLNSLDKNDPMFRIDGTPFYFDTKKLSFSDTPGANRPEKIKLNGGILLEMPRSGKKVTTLALIHSRPCPAKPPKRSHSNATLIVCPSNSYHQWIEEAKKCNPNFRIVALPETRIFESESDRRLLRRKILEQSDIVIISYDSCFDSPNNHFIAHLRFYRIILDQYDKPRSSIFVFNIINRLKSDHIWLLRSYEIEKKQLNGFRLHKLEAPYYTNKVAFLEISKKYIKRNNLNRPSQPHVNQAYVHVKMTKFEKRQCIEKIPRRGEEDSEDDLEDEFAAIGFSERFPSCSADQIEAKLIQANQKHINKINDGIESAKNGRKIMFEGNLKGVEDLEKSLTAAKGNLNFAKEVINTLKTETESMKCLICLSDMVSKRMTILNCAHVYCYDCIINWLDTSEKCPLCNVTVDIYDMMCLKKANLNEMNIDDCSSKFIRFYNYITSELARDPNARIIIYDNFKKVADLIDEHLRLFKIDLIRLKGSAEARHEAIKTFRTSPTCRVMLTCVEDGLFGVHIPEATHLVFYHPISFSSREESDSIGEKIGTDMIGGYETNHPIFINCFVCDDTLEKNLI